MKCIIYTRFSPRPEETKRESIETQLDLCRKWSATHGHEVVGMFEDRALSGDDIERPGLWAALDALRRGYALVVWKFDRLARNAFMSYDIERTVIKKRGSIISAAGEGTMEQHMSPEERLRLGVLRLFAEYEKACTAARTRAAMRWHQAHGRRMSANLPYGWMEDSASPLSERKWKIRHRHTRIIACPEEQTTLGLMIGWRDREVSDHEIARRLTDAGLTCRGKPWHPRSIGRILTRAKQA